MYPHRLLFIQILDSDLLTSPLTLCGETRTMKICNSRRGSYSVIYIHDKAEYRSYPSWLAMTSSLDLEPKCSSIEGAFEEYKYAG